MKIAQDSLHELQMDMFEWDRIFLYGTLGAGKTTLVRHFLSQYFTVTTPVISPTYVYYQQYGNALHFDLYRVRDYDHFVYIGGEEMLDADQYTCFVEWPELLAKYWEPTVSIYIWSENEPDFRDIKIERHQIPHSHRKIDPRPYTPVQSTQTQCP